MKGNKKVFVYGSLKRGFYNHPCIERATYLGTAITCGRKFIMASGGSFPIVYYSGNSTWGYVEGEVYEVTPDILDNVDSLEGHPYWYRRHLTDVLLKDGGKTEVIMYVQDMYSGSLRERKWLDFDPISYIIDVDEVGVQSWQHRWP